MASIWWIGRNVLDAAFVRKLARITDLCGRDREGWQNAMAGIARRKAGREQPAWRSAVWTPSPWGNNR